MQTVNRLKRSFTIITVAALFVLVVAGCVPLDPSSAVSVPNVPPGPGAEEGTPVAAEESAVADGGAVATVTTRSLRVRSAPNADAEVVAGVREGETYPVLDLSSDGQWVLLAVPSAPDGQGWVASTLVSINGALSGNVDLILVPTPITDDGAAESAAAATPVPAEEEATAATIEVPVPEPGFAAVVTDGTRLRVRSEPTTDADIVGYVYAGEVYEVVGASDDGLWIEIAGSTEAVSDNPDGGWVAAEFLVLGE